MKAHPSSSFESTALVNFTPTQVTHYVDSTLTQALTHVTRPESTQYQIYTRYINSFDSEFTLTQLIFDSFELVESDC